MNHLIIYSHPNPKSFNRAICETLNSVLKENGHEVRVRDLYALNFDAVLKQNEMQGFKKGIYPDDIKTEQDHIRWADVITFIGPIWWGGLPAIAKGYMERVLSDGFAYTEGPKGLLPEKKVFTIMTGDAPYDVYEKSGLFKGINQILDDIICAFCAIKPIGHKYFMAVSIVSDAERKAMLKEVKKIAEELR